METTGREMALTREQLSILDHTEHRAARGLYCGDGPDMDRLVELGLMELAGRVKYVPEPYYRITSAGRVRLNSAKRNPEARR